MSREYQDLSRRALIALNKDYDADNNQKLKGYFDKVDPEKHYEGIRPIESMTDKVDQIASTITENGGAIKKAALDAATSTLDKVIDTVGQIINSATEGEV